jgi:hypothetical protein
MIPVLTSFLPPTHTHLYLPVLFRIWEAFNSFSMDDRFLELAGNLSEEHVAGKAGLAGEEGGAVWKDIGIWTHEEWLMLVSKGVESLCRSFYQCTLSRYSLSVSIDVPVGNSGVSHLPWYSDHRLNFIRTYQLHLFKQTLPRHAKVPKSRKILVELVSALIFSAQYKS